MEHNEKPTPNRHAVHPRNNAAYRKREGGVFFGLRRSAENQKFKPVVYVKALRLEWVFLPDFKALQMQAFVHRKTNDF